jgi:hypothetical protein
MPDTGLNPIPQTKVPLGRGPVVSEATAGVSVRVVGVRSLTRYSFDRITTLIPFVKEAVEATMAVSGTVDPAVSVRGEVRDVHKLGSLLSGFRVNPVVGFHFTVDAV